jgi:hypothetical protein
VSFIIAQAGTKLYMLNTSGDIELLTLPTGVTLVDDRTPRFAVLAGAVALVNTPTRSLWIDGEGNVELLTIDPPTTAPTVAAGGAGSISGTIRVKYAFAIIDGDSNIIAQSPWSDPSDPVVVTNDEIDVSDLELSTNEAVNARVIARTLDNGDVYFEAFLLEDNTSTTATLDVADAGLPITPIDDEIESPPDNLEIIVEWNSRFWAKAQAGQEEADIDDILFTEESEFWNWRTSQALLAKPRGGDDFGITAFIARRDELGVGKRTKLLKVIGDDEDTFEVRDVTVGNPGAMGVGPCSHESCKVIDDIGYFLTMERGVWAWGPGGIECVSENDAQPWFTTDRFFNRSRFPFAKSRINPVGPCYELCLAAAGSDVEDRWVSYHIKKKKWLGPHLTERFLQIASAGEVADPQELIFPLLGAEDGHLYTMRPELTNDDGEAIDFDVTFRYLGDGVTSKRNWLQPSVTVRAQPSGTMQLRPVVGEIPADGAVATEQAAIDVDLTRPTTPRLRYLGPGRHFRPRFQCNELDVRAKLSGFEIEAIDIGKR